MKYFFVIIIISVFLSSSLSADVLKKDGGSSLNNEVSQTIIKDKINKNSVDGTTSASKLRARKSHSVSKSDEMGLTIFFGLIVLCVIAFFLKPFSERK